MTCFFKREYCEFLKLLRHIFLIPFDIREVISKLKIPK